MLPSFGKAIWFFFLTGIYWSMSGIGLLVCARAFGIEMPWIAGYTIVGLQVVGALIPGGPGGAGTFQYFTQFGVALFVGHFARHGTIRLLPARIRRSSSSSPSRFCSASSSSSSARCRPVRSCSGFLGSKKDDDKEDQDKDEDHRGRERRNILPGSPSTLLDAPRLFL